MTKRQLYSLFVCNLVMWTVGNGLVPLLPVYATRLGADPAAGGLVATPLPPILAWLSDRMGRKRFLYLGSLAGIASLALLAVSTSLWHFGLVMVLHTVFMAVSGTIGNALVTDLVPRESLGRALALFGAAAWIGGVLGFAGAGFALQRLGGLPTFAGGIGLILGAMVLLALVRAPGRP